MMTKLEGYNGISEKSLTWWLLMDSFSSRHLYERLTVRYGMNNTDGQLTRYGLGVWPMELGRWTPGGLLMVKILPAALLKLNTKMGGWTTGPPPAGGGSFVCFNQLDGLLLVSCCAQY